MMSLIVFALVDFIALAHGLKCYTCESMVDDCDDTSDHPGKLQECPADKNNGCFMTEVITGDTSEMTRGCTDLVNEDAYKCEVHTVGGHAFTFCNCHGDGCNLNWGTAAGPKLKCYECSSSEGKQCDDTHPGSIIECPIESRKGCYMSQGNSHFQALQSF